MNGFPERPDVRPLPGGLPCDSRGGHLNGAAREDGEEQPVRSSSCPGQDSAKDRNSRLALTIWAALVDAVRGPNAGRIPN